MARPLSRLLAAAPPRCAHAWAADTRLAYIWHTCTLAPGHEGDHTCPCGAQSSRRPAA